METKTSKGKEIRIPGPDHPITISLAPGREGLFNLIKSIPLTLQYEAGAIVAEEDFVIVHGRFSDFGAPVNWIAADIVRIEAGKPAEHWDVIQD
jgi:predicted SnoaL-like aldol condensation-catalyzing enzyme